MGVNIEKMAKVFNIGDQVKVEWRTGEWFDATIIKEKRNVILPECSYRVHYKGWNKKFDETIHIDIIRGHDESLPERKSPESEINHNSKAKIPKTRSAESNRKGTKSKRETPKVKLPLKKTAEKLRRNSEKSTDQMPKIQLASEKKAFLAELKQMGLSKEQIKEETRRWTNKINKSLTKIRRDVIANRKLLAEGFKTEPVESGEEEEATHFSELI